jgi:diaminopimelate epimerase
VAALCERGQGVGADGVVYLDAPTPGLVRIVYLNSDGSRAALCGNATLCTATMAVRLGVVAEGESFVIRTDSGDLTARVEPGGPPAFELGAILALATDAPAGTAGAGTVGAAEDRIGFAVAGVPHIVVRVPDVDAVALATRGRQLRQPTVARPEGANVNFVSPGAEGAWRMRTYERGVEARDAGLRHRRGRHGGVAPGLGGQWADHSVDHPVRARRGGVSADDPGRGYVLAGEGRLVFEGTLHDWR